MSDRRTVRWVAAAALIATLGTAAGAADLLPPFSQRYLPHRPLDHLPIVRPDHLPGAAMGLPNGQHADSSNAGWGANSSRERRSHFLPIQVALWGAHNSIPSINFLPSG
jgi:hypothetical protein